MLDAPDGPAEAWVARPDDGPHPGVLFFVDAIGLRPQIASMMERVASWGHVVLAPHVFYREGTAEQLAPTDDLRRPAAREAFFHEAMPRIRSLTPDLSEPDALVWLDALARLAPGPVGVIGYCMGARLALRVAGQAPDVVAAVGGFHGGGLVTDVPDSPHLALRSARAELVLLHADADPSMPAEAVAELGSVIEQAGLVATNEVVPGAPHGYTMEDTSSWDAAAAERHYAALQDLFRRGLGRATG
ncbi:dienelactone hydrolase [Aeromicrobium sp. Root495]|nr:dienelactone hydrolase [Aeromicrobium sp. Root495]